MAKNIGKKRKCPECAGSGKVSLVAPDGLRRARQRAGIGLREMSRKIGVSSAHLSKMELGQTPVTPRVVRLYEREIGRPA